MKAQQECIFIFGYFVCLRLYFPVNNYSAMSAKWRLTVHPILGYQGEKGGGGQMYSHCFLEGANIHHYAFVEGGNYPPLSIAWGGGDRCPHMPFFIGGRCQGGGGMSGSHLKIACTEIRRRRTRRLIRVCSILGNG